MSGNASVLQAVIEMKSQACNTFLRKWHICKQEACGVMTTMVESGQQRGAVVKSCSSFSFIGYWKCVMQSLCW